MKTVILCGGLGTRIRDVSENLPKPMIPVGPYPILWHIMRHYDHFGHKDFILTLGYLSHKIKDFFINHKTYASDFTIDMANDVISTHKADESVDWRVTLAETGLNTMTGSRVKKIARYIGKDEHFMLTYGDGVSDVNLDELIEFHKRHNKLITVTGVRPPGRFGEIEASDAGIVSGFNEKPQSTGGLISGGFFVCHRNVFEYLRDGEDLVFEKDPLKALVADQQMAVYRHEGFWHPMDTHRDYLFLNELYSKGEAPWIH